MLDDVIGDLACTVCGSAVVLEGRAVRCTRGHSFDVARQGYASMLAGRRAPAGDDPEMVAARERFLAAGHFGPLADAVVAAASARPGSGCVVDAGAGTGYYLARALDALPDRSGIALDSSPAALRRAARCHARAGAVSCDVWSRFPLRTAVAGVVLDVFAPRNGAEMRRVLGPDGALVVATPTERHLRELVAGLGLLRVDEEKERRVEDAVGKWFERTHEVVVEHAMTLRPSEVADVVGMGPSARHAPPGAGRLPDPVRVTSSVKVSTYVPRP